MFPTLQMMATSSVLKAGILTPDLTNHPVLFPFLSNTSIDTTELLQVEFSTSSLYVPIYDVKPSSFGIGCYFTTSPQLTFVFPYADSDKASLIQSEATEAIYVCLFIFNHTTTPLHISRISSKPYFPFKPLTVYVINQLLCLNVMFWLKLNFLLHQTRFLC